MADMRYRRPGESGLAVSVVGIGFVSAPNEYSLLRRSAESELVPACKRFGVGLLPYFPLASGLLTGRYRRDDAPPPGSRLAEQRWASRLAQAPWDKIEKIEEYARERSLSMLQVAIGWLAAQPAVASVIAGATVPDQVRANAAAMWEPSVDNLAHPSQITDE